MVSSEEGRCDRIPPDTPWFMSVSSGAIVPPSCRAWLCPACGPRKAIRLGRALDNAGYDFCFTATRAPTDLRQGVARLRHRISRHGPWEWCWSAERGPKTGMVHVHACVRGTRRSHRTELSPAARRAGWGFVWVTTRGERGFGDYARKMGTYSVKQLADYPAWRTLNGSRPWHWSRGYTHGVPMRDWTRKHAPARDPGPWRVIPAREAVAMEEHRAGWEARREVWARDVLASRHDQLTETLAHAAGHTLALDVLGAYDVTNGDHGPLNAP